MGGQHQFLLVHLLFVGQTLIVELRLLDCGLLQGLLLCLSLCRTSLEFQLVRLLLLRRLLLSL